ncbi:uncharacterized protein LOC130722286 isoform X2 [Lotus japonicus]|uniref:uncharacterized protein LOC130722286 isoform X2 n=1 Tax=Lotus japonicus TaxID=34305 RepID=UPI00258303B5|nr:uncharacterized protein LOC130722286 isoform X2 [Lotus japonicus]
MHVSRLSDPNFGILFQVGFEMADTIAEAEGISMNSVSFKALFGKVLGVVGCRSCCCWSFSRSCCCRSASVIENLGHIEILGYKIIGSYSGVKICRWTKSQLRARGGCYKHSFYGIESHRHWSF